jgi:hypothetical protein
MIFILGSHRSGTTILYNALVAAGPFCHPTPYHLAHFRDFRRNERFDPLAAMAETERRFRSQGIVDRFVDGIPAHARSPEEYGFALPGGRLTRDTLDTFLAFCDFVRSGAEPDRLLLLKNPRDLPNVRFIHRTFPEAKFIFIHRHPGPTIESRLRELRLLFSRRSPYQAEIEPRYDEIMRGRALRLILRTCLRPGALVRLYFLFEFRRNARHLLRQLASLPRESYSQTTYEELCREPERVVQGLLAFLGVGRDDGASLRGMIRPAAGGANGDRILRSALAVHLLRPYLEHCGYRGLWPAATSSPERDRRGYRR